MAIQEQVTKKVVEQVIRENLARFRKELDTSFLDILDKSSPGECGCKYDKGCCRDQGCCRDKGCCSEKDNEVISDLVGDRIDLLQDYIMSNKEPIVRFFKTRGIDLDL